MRRPHPVSSRAARIGIRAGATAIMLVAAAACGRDMTTIPGLVLWLKADAITAHTNGQSVAAWGDASTNRDAVGQPNPANQPTYYTNRVNGLPAIGTVGAATVLAGSNSITLGPRTYACVFKLRATTPLGTWHSIALQSLTPFFQLYGGSTDWLFYDGTSTALRIQPSTNVVLLVVTRGTNSLAAYTNGVQTLSTNRPALSPLSATFHVLGWNKLYAMNGYLSELAVYDTALSASQRQLAEGVLAWKYGLQHTLPASHPWRTRDPNARLRSILISIE